MAGKLLHIPINTISCPVTTQPKDFHDINHNTNDSLSYPLIELSTQLNAHLDQVIFLEMVRARNMIMGWFCLASD